MSAHLDELYFEWLYSQISSVKLKNPSRTYWKLLKILFTKEFVWIVPNDDNRIQDGKDLRIEFLSDKVISNDPEYLKDWIEMGCSTLELLLALAKRLAFETNGEPAEWFWELIENLKLREYNDSCDIPQIKIETKLDRVIWRTYRSDGSGGLFPLKEPERDQRDVELWYQLSAYVLERT